MRTECQLKSTAFWARFMAILLLFALSLPNTVFAKIPVNVVVSIAPLAEMVNAVGGHDVRMSVLLPQNTAPALYEPTSKALVQLRRADIFVGIGLLPFETIHWNAFISQNKTMHALALGKTLHHHQLIFGHNHHHHPDDEADVGAEMGVDPHVWMDPLIMKEFSREFAKALVQREPRLATQVKLRLAKYEAHLDRLHAQIQEQLANQTQRFFITYHPTYTYFANRYGLEQRSLEHEGKPPTLTHMVNLERTARYKNIKVVIVENHYRSRLANRFARKIGTEVVVVNPLSPKYSQSLLLLANIISNPKFK
ncbi:MAG: zinc ABC transporter substrate-binding protein [bacterium]|nr:zinc ABC transporter substrate-binding protein [bacterium]